MRGADGNQKNTRRNETKQDQRRCRGDRCHSAEGVYVSRLPATANCVSGASSLPCPPLRTSLVVCFGVYFKPVPLHLLWGTLRNMPLPINFD